MVDIGFGLNYQNIFRLDLDIGKQNLKNQIDEKYKANIHYNLANSYFSLFGLAKRNTVIETISQSENLQKAKLHFREALKFSE